MKIKTIFILLLLIIKPTWALDIDSNSSNLDLLPVSSIYIDSTHTLSKEIIETQVFTINTQSILTLGFSPNSALWIKFTLKNRSNQSIKKVLEYANPLTEEIFFFDGNRTILEGTWHIAKKRFSINPTFQIILNPYEERTFYLKAHSTISTVIAQLILWNANDFTQKDSKQKNLVMLFFTILMTLLLYNSFIYFFTKDRAYLYYILYLSAIIMNESTYAGVAQLYLLSSYGSVLVTQYIMLLVAFMIVTIILFTREFLQTTQFKKLDFLLKSVLYLVPILSLLSCNNFLFNANIIVLFLPIGGLVIFVGFYAFFHGVKEAQFYIIGWSMVLVALIVTNLQTLGILNINEYVKYMNDGAFISEAFLFSIALAHRIKITNDKLLSFQYNEQKRLEKLVSLKTQELKASLEKEELLYRELNHRVKNNFQMILSLIKLQIFKASTPLIKEELTTIKDRINSIAHLYEMLKIKGDKPLKSEEYFQNIVDNIKKGFDIKVTITYEIRYDLPIDKLIYCGLILNELVTNSFKYAFEQEGTVDIALYREEDSLYLTIKDNGKGYPPANKRDSLGLTIIETLVHKQLLGKMQIHILKGVENIISWKV